MMILRRRLSSFLAVADIAHFDLRFFLIQVLLFTALLLLLMPDRILHPTFFAEDGVVFFADQYQASIWPIFEAYNGYLHLYPRLVAWFGSSLPLDYAPHGYVFAGLVAIWLFLFSCNTLSSFTRGQRLLMSTSVLLSPLGTECLLNAVNAQWLLQFSLIFMLLRGSIHGYDLPMLVLVALTGPFVVILLPVILLVFWQKKLFNTNPLKSWCVLIIAVSAVSLQASHILVRVKAPLNLQYDVPSLLNVTSKIIAAVATITGLIIALTYAWRKRSDLIFLPVAGLVFLLAEAVVSRTSFLAYGRGISPRYFLLPLTMGLWFFLLYRDDRHGILMLHRLAWLVLVVSTLAFFPLVKRYPNRNWHTMVNCLRDTSSNLCVADINPDGWRLQIQK